MVQLMKSTPKREKEAKVGTRSIPRVGSHTLPFNRENHWGPEASRHQRAETQAVGLQSWLSLLLHAAAWGLVGWNG